MRPINKKYAFDKEDTLQEHFVKEIMQKIDPEVLKMAGVNEEVLIGDIEFICSLIVWSSNIYYINKAKEELND